MGPTDCPLLFPPHDDLRRRWRRGRGGDRCGAGAVHKAKITQFTSRAATKTDGPCPSLAVVPPFFPSGSSTEGGPRQGPRCVVIYSSHVVPSTSTTLDSTRRTADDVVSVKGHLGAQLTSERRKSGRRSVTVHFPAKLQKNLHPWRRRPCLHSGK